MAGELETRLGIEWPLPPLGDWTVAPDFAELLVSELERAQPALVVELGSGVSTLIAAHRLRRIGHGKVLALDHELTYARRTSRLVADHGLTGWARVVHAPLRTVELGAERWRWYERAALNAVSGVGLVVVDGPPADLGPMARYPAVPVLAPSLTPDAVVICDDLERPDEQAIVARWLEEHPDIEVERPDLERGAAVLRLTRAT